MSGISKTIERVKLAIKFDKHDKNSFMSQVRHSINQDMLVIITAYEESQEKVAFTKKANSRLMRQLEDADRLTTDLQTGPSKAQDRIKELEDIQRRFKAYTDAHQKCHCGASFVTMLKQEQTDE